MAVSKCPCSTFTNAMFKQMPRSHWFLSINSQYLQPYWLLQQTSQHTKQLKNVRHATSTFPITHLICLRKFCITFVFYFSWVLQPSQEKLKTVLMQNFWGQRRCIMGIVEVAYGRKRDFLLFFRHLHIFHNRPCLLLKNLSITLTLYFP